jgi:hypothetical protein
MKGYIYTMYEGADPGRGWVMNDPIFTPQPTLGACVPNIRRAVEVGDYVFAISGRVKAAKQFVVGGFKVAEKIAALAAFGRFPGYRLRELNGGQVYGNVIITPEGNQHHLDHHSNFERRLENYIVGSDPVFLTNESEYDRSREETVTILQEIFKKSGDRIFDIIGRQRRMDEAQVGKILDWLEDF